MEDGKNWIRSNLAVIFFFIPYSKKIRWMRAVCKRLRMNEKIAYDFHHPLLNY